MTKSVSLHGPTVFWALLIFSLSSVHSLNTPDLGFQIQDKVFHALEFAVFGVLLRRSAATFFSSGAALWGATVLTGIVYAALDEMHQYFVPGREADWADLVADVIGIFLGILVFRLWMHCTKA